MKAGKLEPIAVVQGGKSIAFAEFMKPAAAPAAAPGPTAAPAPAAAPAAPAPKQ